MSDPTPTALATLGGVIVCWFVFAAIIVFRKLGPKTSEAKRDKFPTLGIALQMCGYALVWFQRPRRAFLPPVPALAGTAGIVYGAFTVSLAAASVWLMAAAVRTLGKQWAVAARLVEGHKLITVGPYSYIRNPIYTGMFGMLIATGLAMQHWWVLVPATVIFAAGMVIRVRSEERLLRSAFGEEFEDYAGRVPAVLPGIF